MRWFKKKEKKSKQEEDLDNLPDPGTFKYAYKTGTKNPMEFYHMRLAYLKEKRKNKRNNQKSLLKDLKKWWNKKKQKEEVDLDE